MVVMKLRSHRYVHYWYMSARSRYLRKVWVIASHRILWDAITYPCLRYLLLVPKSSYLLLDPFKQNHVFNTLTPARMRHQLLTHFSLKEVKVILHVYFSNSVYKIEIFSTSRNVGLSWVPQNPIDGTSTLLEHLTIWRHQASTNYCDI